MRLHPQVARLIPASLGGRLILGSIAITLVAGLITLVGIGHLLERFVIGQIDQRLDNKLLALASQVKVAADGTIHLDGDADGPPFDKPHHQSFWWVGGPKNSLRTAWLKPGTFTPPTTAEIEAAPAPPSPPKPPALSIDTDAPSLPPDRPGLGARTLDVAGPQGVPIHVRVVRRDIAGVSITILAAAPEHAIVGPMRETLTSLGGAVLVFSLVVLFAAFSLVRISLMPLAQLQAAVAEVRTGRSNALPDEQPIEIRPLVEELNSLLAQNAENLSRARRHVANLAHGLKTPLATLSLTVDRLDGQERAAMQVLVASIERRVRHHLGRARAAALDGPVRAQTLLEPRFRDLVDTLDKIHADKRVVASIDCRRDFAVACETQDIDEILGNLLENAFKYTRRRVGCQVRASGGTVVVEITDDGPGLSPDEIERALRPGQRLDEDTPGHGFGLPIARELTELYGGTLTLASEQQGLKVTLTLPGVR